MQNENRNTETFIKVSLIIGFNLFLLYNLVDSSKRIVPLEFENSLFLKNFLNSFFFSIIIPPFYIIYNVILSSFIKLS